MSGRAWIGVAALAVVIAGGLVIWLGSRSSPEQGWTAESVRWTIQGRPSGRVLKIGVESGKCLGQPIPRLLRPEVSETDEEVSIGATVEKFLFTGNCAGVGLFFTQTVVLAEPVGDRRLLDLSEDPPVQRWPAEQ